jgi:hypothetical protein
VDTRIKSAQDDFGAILARLQPEIRAAKFSQDSPEQAGEGKFGAAFALSCLMWIA